MSPVILLGLVVMWVVVLVPMWLRRHDEVEETRSVDRFSSAMHTLSRREPADKKYVVMPHRSRELEVHVSGASADGSRKRTSKAARRSRAPRRVLTPSTRRRRTLIGLLLVTAVTVALFVVIGGIELLAVQAAADVFLLFFVGHLWRRGRRARAARPAQRRPAQVTRPSARPERASKPAPTAKPATRSRPAPVAFPDPVEIVAAELMPMPMRMSVPIAAGAREPLFDQTGEPDFAAVASEGTRYVRYRFDDTTVDEPAGGESERTIVTFDDVEPAAATYVAAPATVELEPALPYQPVAETELDNAVGERPWEPVPVPRPVYATKPAAPRRRPRAPIMEPLLPPIDSPEELDPVDDLEEILDRRWAVND